MATNKSNDQSTGPPSIRQQQILDAAADHPDTSMEDLASEIPSATTELVERVLETYGDPAEEEPETSHEETGSPTDECVTPDLSELSTKQLEVLHAISEQPTATQQELADTLNVSGATVCNRVNSISGFNWDDRQSFIDTVFETEPTLRNEEISPMASNGTKSSVAIDQLIERVTTIEQQLTDLADADESDTVGAEFADPELTHKVAHACLTSDAITEDEELRIMKALLR